MGKGVAPEDHGLGDFAPKGEPEMLGRGGTADMGGEMPGGSAMQDAAASGEGSKPSGAAMGEFSGVKRGPRFSSSKGQGERVTIPTEGEKSIANRKT